MSNVKMKSYINEELKKLRLGVLVIKNSAMSKNTKLVALNQIRTQASAYRKVLKQLN